MPADDRQLFEDKARRNLERSRYVNASDWIERWKTLEPLCISKTKDFINAYPRGENPSSQDWQGATRGPKAMPIEVARWLNGERNPEPAIVMAAEHFGFICTLEPAIELDFLHELTSFLPPLVFADAPHEEPDMFDFYEEFAA